MQYDLNFKFSFFEFVHIVSSFFIKLQFLLKFGRIKQCFCGKEIVLKIEL